MYDFTSFDISRQPDVIIKIGYRVFITKLFCLRKFRNYLCFFKDIASDEDLKELKYTYYNTKV